MSNREQVEERFEVALRGAIADSGLTLRELRDRLGIRGLAVSLATLSHWQSGRSRPEGTRSLAVVRELEHILDLPGNGLAALLGTTRSRGRNARAPRRLGLSRLWENSEDVTELAARFPPLESGGLRSLSHHDRFTIGPDRRARSLRTWQVLQAEFDGADRTTLINHVSDGVARPPVVRALSQCTTGRIERRSAAGLVAVELILERPLARGELVVIEHEVCYRRPYPQETFYERKLPLPVRHHVIEVDFSGGAAPRRCEHYTTPHVDISSRKSRELVPNVFHNVHAVVMDVAGISGVRWTW
ncbi:hypothetical protein AB0M43_01885 [Longispora sp. NPDC051575]|uniref:helix-turn-helix domain-containing protein n=1 Tax=Longispora sp. NPDC051575 TaxID=3154943 RepID=UPI003426C099